MNLLEQEIIKDKKTSSSKKNIVLALLILCIIALIMLLAMISVLKSNEPLKEVLFVDGVESQIKEGLIITDDLGTKYISLQLGGELLKYKYYNGEYGENEEDKNKCYLQNNYEVIGLQVDSNKIYKIDLEDNIGKQEFTLSNKVKKDTTGSLYVTIEDFSKVFYVGINISEDGKQIQIKTCKHIAELQTENIKTDNKYTLVDSEYNNLKAIYYNLFVVSDGTNYGVVNADLETIIGTKYKSIVFNEYTKNFIALSNNKYGILSTDGKVIIEFKYDNLRLLNYKPLLYEVKQNNKYGVLDDKGNMIINTEYDRLGYNSNDENDSVLIIKNIDNKEDGMVVCKNGKYGVVSIETGETILECELEKIYSRTLEDDETIKYYVQIKGYEYELEEYIRYVNTTTVNIPNG